MPKSRHRKNQKSKSKNRTIQIKAQIKKIQKEQMEKQMKLIEEAQKQREANLKKQEEQSSEGETYGFSPNNTL
tara:strand:- start:15 stop:233 length:219 start_codon:yes stop_codon:yes gene_type:complete